MIFNFSAMFNSWCCILFYLILFLFSLLSLSLVLSLLLTILIIIHLFFEADEQQQHQCMISLAIHSLSPCLAHSSTIHQTNHQYVLHRFLYLYCRSPICLPRQWLVRKIHLFLFLLSYTYYTSFTIFHSQSVSAVLLLFQTILLCLIAAIIIIIAIAVFFSLLMIIK